MLLFLAAIWQFSPVAVTATRAIWRLISKALKLRSEPAESQVRSTLPGMPVIMCACASCPAYRTAIMHVFNAWEGCKVKCNRADILLQLKHSWWWRPGTNCLMSRVMVRASAALEEDTANGWLTVDQVRYLMVEFAVPAADAARRQLGRCSTRSAPGTFLWREMVSRFS